MNRRHFAKLAAFSSISFGSKKLAGAAADKRPVWTRPLSVHVFSKHLQFLDYKEMAKVVADLGFDGIDLTVRKGGHVKPTDVVEELPKAVEAIANKGLLSLMFTSDVTNATDPVNIQVLNTASEQGYKYYRMGYYKYAAEKSWRETLDGVHKDMVALAELNKDLGLHGAYQNHSGQYVGSYIPDLVYMLEDLDPRWSGCQYDIRHATVEGGKAWPMGVEWLKDYLSTIVIKDFMWAERNGKYNVLNTPVGEGMVDFIEYFKLLRKLGIHPTVTMHAEYDLGGANDGKRELTIPKRQVYKALGKDLKKLRELWQKSAQP